MIPLNIIFAALALFFVIRGIKLFLLFSRSHNGIKECAISIAISIMHFMIMISSLMLIEVGEQTIKDAGLLLNYYLYLGTVTIQILISDFVIKFLYDKITKRMGS